MTKLTYEDKIINEIRSSTLLIFGGLLAVLGKGLWSFFGLIILIINLFLPRE